MSDRQLAVALKYVRGDEDAPRIVAKGRGPIAQKILKLAQERGIPIHRDTDLVEVLVKLDMGELIPPELYRVVAEILAYLYQINRKAIV